MGIMRDSPNLDLLRSTAVGLVVLSHMRGYLDLGPWGFKFMGAVGHMGVAIFFVHTALVLMMSLERNGPAAGPFFVRRFFRIYPLSIVMVLFVTGLISLGPSPVDYGVLVSNLLLVQNLTGHTSGPAALWSLPYEVQMYLFLPALYAITRMSRPALRLALVWLASVALAVLGLIADIPSLRFIPCFVAGVLAYHVSRRATARLNPLVLFAVVAAGVVLVPAAAANGMPEILKFGPARPWNSEIAEAVPLWWPFCLALGLIIPHCRPIGISAMVRLGKVVATYSYGVYLTHVFAVELAFMMPVPWPVRVGVFAVLLPGFAYLAYHGIEKHGIALGVRLAGRIGVARATRSAVQA